MSEKRSRRRWTAAKKLKLVLESMEGGTKMADICRREGLSPNLLHQWRKQLLGSAEEVFGRKSKGSSLNGAEERLRIENDRMKNVIAEITADTWERFRRIMERFPLPAATAIHSVCRRVAKP